MLYEISNIFDYTKNNTKNNKNTENDENNNENKECSKNENNCTALVPYGFLNIKIKILLKKQLHIYCW